MELNRLRELAGLSPLKEATSDKDYMKALFAKLKELDFDSSELDKDGTGASFTATNELHVYVHNGKISASVYAVDDEGDDTDHHSPGSWAMSTVDADVKKIMAVYDKL